MSYVSILFMDFDCIMYINKEEYLDFEKNIANNFNITKTYKTNLVPTNGKPSILKNNKVVLCLDFVNNYGKSLSQLVQSNEKIIYQK